MRKFYSIALTLALLLVSVGITAQTSFRWSEDFENATTGAGNVPTGWDNSDYTQGTSSTSPSNTYKWYVNSNATAAHGGSKYAYLYCYYYYVSACRLKTSAIALPSTKDAMVSFWLKNSSATGGDFSVYVSTDGGTTYTQNPLAQHVLTGTTWTQYNYPLSAFKGQTITLVFEGASGASTSYYYYLDDIVVEYAPTCQTPTDPYVNSLTSSSATLNWGLDTRYGVNPDQFSVTLRDAAGNLVYYNGNVANDYSNTFSFTGLTSATTYTAYVRSNCDVQSYQGYSDSVSVQFTTIAPATNLPYYEGFDSLATLPNTFYTSNAVMNSTASLSHSASKSMKLTVTATNGAYLIFPAVNAIANNMEVDYWIRRGAAGTTNVTYYVGYLTDPSNIEGSFVAVQTDSLAKDALWHNKRFNTAQFAGQPNPDTTTPVMFCIQIGSGVAATAYIDDISIHTIPTCTRPENLVITDYKATEVTLDWSMANASNVRVYAMDPEDSTIVKTALATTHPYTMTGLTAQTDYLFAVRGICSATDSSEISTGVEIQTRCDVAASTTFFEGAEGTTGSDIPECWETGHIHKTTTATTPPFYTGTTTKIDARGFILRDMTSGNISYLCSQALNFDVMSKYSFRYKINRSSGTANVGEGLKIFVTPTVGDTTNAVQVIPFVNRCAGNAPVGTSGWNEYEGVINYQGIGYIMVVGYSKWGNSTCFDNLEVFLTPTCPKVSNISAGNATKHSLDITWNRGLNETQWLVDYQVKQGNTTIIDSVGVLVSGQPSITVSNLNSATTYSVTASVRAYCGVGDTSEVVSMATTNVSTQCDAISQFPYTMGFEESETYVVSGTTRHPSCWTHYNNATSTTDSYKYAPYAGTSNARTGSRCLYYYNYASSTTYGDTATFALPEIDTTVYSVNALRVKFWTRNSTTTSYNQTIYVGVMTNPNDPSTFVKVDSVAVTGATYVETVSQLNNYVGNGSFIAFAWYKAAMTSNYSYIYMDDITVEPIPSCADLAGAITVTAVSDTSMSFTMADQTATNWQYAYGLTGTPVAQMTPVSRTGSTCVLTGLTEATTYDIYVRRDCGAGDYGAWAQKVTFSTTAVPAQMPYVCGFEDAQENARWQYVDGAGANVFTVGSTAAGVYDGSNAMYVTSNRTTATYTYDNGSSTKSFAYRTMHFDAKGYQVEMKWKATGGESNYDFGRIFLTAATENLPAGGTGSNYTSVTFPNMVAQFDEAYKNGSNIQLNTATTSQGNPDANGWHVISYFLDMTNRPGDYNLVFWWSNDGSVGTANYPLSVDDIHIWELTCIPPSTIVVDSLTSVSARINIQQNDASQWEVVVNTTSFSDEAIPDSVTYRAIVNNPVVNLTGLTPNTDYYYLVRTICGANDTSDWNEIALFHTFCAMVNLPLTENFEGTSSTMCWNTPDGVGTISRVTAYRHQGTASMKIAGATAVSPEFNVTTLANDMLNGWCYTTADSASFLVGIMTDPNDISTFEPLTNVVIPAKNQWFEFTTYFNLLNDPDYADFYNARYIVIATGTDVIYFDDFIIDATPTCPKPTETSISNITAHSFDISFTNNAPGCTQWVVYTNGTPNVINATSATISGLAAHSTYSVEVAAICSATDTSYTTLCGTVNTECDALPTPYSCGFEPSDGFAYSGSWVDGVLEAQCWQTLRMAGTSYPYYRITNATYLHSGTQGLMGYSSSSTYAYYILPSFTDPTDSLTMEFWYRNESITTATPYVEVGYMTNPLVDTTFVMLQKLPKVTVMTKVEQSYIGIGVPRNARIAIRFGDATSNNYYCGIDDIYVKRIRSCSDPNIPTVSDVTASSASIAFTDTCATHTNWEYVYGTSGFDPSTGTPVAIDSTRSFTLTGLNGETNYYVYVRANCGGGDYSNWVPVSFKTLCQPFHVTATNMFSESFSDYNYNQYLNTGTCFDIIGEPASNSYWAKVYPTTEPSATSSYKYCYGHSADPMDKCLYWTLYKTSIPNGSILRQFHLDGGQTYEISAYVRNSTSTSYSSKVSTLVGESTTSLDTLTYTVCDGASLSSVSEGGYYWYYYNTLYEQTKTFFTPDSTGDYFIGYNVGFNNTYSNTYLYLDDWTIRAFAGCAPRVPSVDSVTTTAAYFSVSDTAFYQYEYVINDTTLTPTVVTTNTFAVTGLSPASGYTMYIRRYCDATTYSEWLAVPFNTGCGAVTTFPYTQDFEGTFLPACWSQRYYGDASYTNAWASSSTYHHSGSKCAYIPDRSSGSKTALTTSELMLTNPNGYEVTLWVYRQSTSYQNYTQEGMYIYVSNTPIQTAADAAAATQIGFVAAHYANAPVEAGSGWYEYTFAIPTSLTGSRYVNVCYHNYYGSGSYFDDLTVAEVPPCREPKVAPVIADYTMTTMTVQAAMAGKDTIEFGIAPYSANVTPAAIDTTVISTDGNACFTGLTGATRYAVWYRYHCGADGVSGWSTLYANATTMSTDCYEPQNLRTVGVVNDHHAEITWGGAPLVYRFDYELYQGTSINGTLIDSGSVAVADTLVYDSLPAITNFFFRVRGFCSGDTTAWVNLPFQTTRSAAPMPFICGFENAIDATYWETGDNGGDNAFVIGSDVSNGGSQSLYLSNDGGTYDYTSDDNQAYARVLLPMTAGNYLVSYDYYCYGESSYDYGRLFLYPAANATGCISSLSYTAPTGNITVSANQISGMANWATAQYIVTVPVDAMYYFQVNWEDDSSVENGDPIAIDNVHIEEIQCMPLTSVTNLSLTSHSAKYVATRYEAGLEIQYGYSTVDSQDSITWTSIQGTGLTDTIVLNGLVGNTTYYLFAREVCDSTHISAATRVQFSTPNDAQALPFICGFEPSEATTNAWTLIGSNNEFTVGTGAASQGANAMYISDDASSWNYTITTISNSYAFVPLAFGPGTYDIEYDWQAYGESTFDYGRVYLAPASFVPTAGTMASGIGTTTTPTGWIALDGGSKLNLVSDWQSVALEQTFSDSTTMNLLVFWHNDGSVGTQPPFAIDNIRITKQLCTSLQFSSLAADTIGEDMFTITYVNPTPGAATMYHVSSNAQMTDTIAYGTRSASDTAFTVTGLSAGTVYYCALYSVCGVDTLSKALKFNIRTTCALMTQFPYDEGFEDMTPMTYNLLTGMCWATTTMSSTLYSVASNTASYVHSGNQGLYIYNSSTSTNYQILALPEMANLNGKSVSFWHKAYSTTASYAVLSFGYMNASNQFVALDNFNNKVTDWQQHQTTISNLPAGTTRLAFKITGMYYYYLDDIHINDVVQGSTYYDTICFGAAYNAHGFSYPAGSLAAGDTTFNATIPATQAGQADSITTAHVYVRPEIVNNLYDTVCEGQPYNKGMFNIPNPQTRVYFRTFTSVLTGCDSTVNLNLYVYPTTQTLNDTICQGDAYQFGSQTLTQPGTYQDSIVSPFGCTTFTTLYLYVADSAIVTNATICQGGSYQFEGQTYTQAGTYRVTKTGVHGCPLVSILNLTVNSNDSTVITSFCKGGSVTVVDTIIQTAGQYVISRFDAKAGCTTVYHITATEDPIKTGYESDNACQDHLYYGFGLSGVVITKDTVVNQYTRDWEGKCDSMTVATIKYVATVTGIVEEKTIAAGESYIWHDQSRSESGYYYDTIPSEVTGCDSICTLKLTVGDVPPTGVENVEMLNISVVPNPVNAGQTSFIYGNFTNVKSVEVLNSFGQVIDTFVPETYPIEVQGINASGIYYVRVVTEDEKVAVQKLIVK